MILAFLLIAAQAGAAAPADAPSMNSAQRRVVDSMAPWMQCTATPVADIVFPTRAAADAAADAALAACRNEENAMRAALTAALPRQRARALLASFRDQFRAQVRAGTIKRTPAAIP